MKFLPSAASIAVLTLSTSAAFTDPMGCDGVEIVA